MSKKNHAVFMIINAIFVVLNGFFMVFSPTPAVNFYSAMFCLIGVIIAYNNWVNTNE